MGPCRPEWPGLCRAVLSKCPEGSSRLPGQPPARPRGWVRLVGGQDLAQRGLLLVVQLPREEHLKPAYSMGWAGGGTLRGRSRQAARAGRGRMHGRGCMPQQHPPSAVRPCSHDHACPVRCARHVAASAEPGRRVTRHARWAHRMRRLPFCPGCLVMGMPSPGTTFSTCRQRGRTGRQARG